ncbi:MAG: hypothetical protein JXA13_13100 [Anaerolineales bacterium]|nr:hypothetical protein [Anaerolineales bacterium]
MEQINLDQETISWLLSSSPWTVYRSLSDLLDQPDDNHEVRKAHQDVLRHPLINNLFIELENWPQPAIKRHNDANHILHKFVFLADIGLTVNEKKLQGITDKITENQSPEGMLHVKVNIPIHFGGTGLDQLTWILCDSPSILYALKKMGVMNSRLNSAADFLAGLIRDNGWACTAAPELNNFKGPGRRDDPCPYANLISLKALAQFPEWKESHVCRTGADSILTLWEQRKKHKPYLFGMGKKFARLKAPLIWYDILHVLDVLTQFEWLHTDPRLIEMLTILEAKADQQGRYKAESVWRAWSDWDFGQKREPSPWITFLAHRILKRVMQFSH